MLVRPFLLACLVGTPSRPMAVHRRIAIAHLSQAILIQTATVLGGASCSDARLSSSAAVAPALI